MYKNTLRKIVGWQLLAVILVSIIITAFGQTLLSASASADTPTPPKDQATWFYKPENCSQSGMGQASAALAYTDDNGNVMVFDCLFIAKTSSLDYMQLQGTAPCKGGTPPSVIVGRDANHQTSNFGPLATSRLAFLTVPSSKTPDGQCTTVTAVPVNRKITNTYTDGSVPPPPATVGSATWQEPLQNNQGELKANYAFDLGGGAKYTSPKDETFNQTNVTPDGKLVLSSQTQAAPGTTCNVNEIDYGPDVTSKTATVTISLWGYEGGSDLHCYQRTGGITLNKSFSDIGGTITAPSGSTNGGGIDCPVNDPFVGWMLCPIFNLAKGAVQKLTDSIDAVLFFDTNKLFGANSSFQNSYNIFRNIGLSLLVVAGLVMVVSQAAGLDIFSAYTIRKMLPRIVLAAIGISLAWPILQIVITFFNDLGGWISDVILVAAPSGYGNSYTGIGAKVLAIVIGGATAIGAGVAAAAAALFNGVDIIGIMSFMLTITLGLLLGYVVLVIRLMILLVCIIIAPLAIAASVMPGTEKLWKFWRETLLGVLLMYPIVMAFLSAGAAMAAVAAVLGQTVAGMQGFILDFIAVVAYFIPFFLIPLAFRMASGLMGNIFGMINDRSKGIFDGLKKGRQERRQHTKEALQHNNRFKTGMLGTGAIGQQWDKFAGKANPLLQKGYLRMREPINAGRRAALGSSLDFDAAMTAAEKNPHVQAILANDDFLMAIRKSDGTAASIKKYLGTKGYTEAEFGGVENAIHEVGFHNMKKLAATYLPSTGTAFKDQNDGGAAMLEALNDAYGDDRLGFSRALAKALGGASQARRIDLTGGSFSQKLVWAARLRKAAGTADEQAVHTQVLAEMDAAALDTTNPGLIVNARNSALDRLIPTMNKQLQAAIDTGSQDQIDNQAAFLAALYDEMGRSSKENAALMADEVMGRKINIPIPGTSGTSLISLQQYIERYARNSPRFQEWRREYATRAGAAAAEQERAAAAAPAGGAGAPGGQ